MASDQREDTNPRPSFIPGRASFTLIIVRLFVCSFAMFAAVVAAGLLGAFGLFRGLESEELYSLAFAITALAGVTLILSQILAPGAVVVILTEAFGIKNPFFYLFAGASIAGLLMRERLALEQAVILSVSDAPQDRRILIAIASGIIGGFTYWLFAGRNAGSYRERKYLEE